ncbi:MAG: hypothetical protein LUE17_03090 [Planctomycetaceae bacterium]|nr:hypothetical protein [Planctomycetaceae bacterium]
MESTGAIRISFITIPAHKFIYIQNRESNGYWDFWEKQRRIPGQDQATVTGLLDTIEGKLDDDGGQIMAYISDPEGRMCAWGFRRTECWGVRLPADSPGDVPPPLLMRNVPEGEYIVFEHGPFNIATDNQSVEEAIEKAMAAFDYTRTDYRLDTAPGRIMYFIHYPVRYWKYIRPVRKN